MYGKEARLWILCGSGDSRASLLLVRCVAGELR